MIAYIEYNDFFYCLKMSTAKTEITEIECLSFAMLTLLILSANK